MAKICCICGKRQNSIIVDYELGDDLTDYRICSDCFNTKYELIDCSKNENEGYISAKEYFDKFLQREDIDETVLEYMDYLMIKYDNWYNGIENEMPEIVVRTSKNTVSKVLKLIAIINIVIGLIIVIIGVCIVPSYFFRSGGVYFFTSFVYSLLIYGIGEIIMLLQKLVDKR